MGYAKSKSGVSLAKMRISYDKEALRIVLRGRLDNYRAAPVWRKVLKLLAKRHTKPIHIDASGLEYADGSGVALLAYFKEYGQKNNLEVKIKNLSQNISSLLDSYTENPPVEAVKQPESLNLIERIGQSSMALAGDAVEQIIFLGRLTLATAKTIFTPRRFRAGDFFRMCELTGANAIGIIALLGFLFGLIMAFSSAMPLRQFGVEIYVADLVAIALARVLGPFITAIIVAGRTGSAFAAELGTMKINNELDALKVMNLDPAVFLVLPRVAATLLMTPLLAIITNVAGLIGSGLVILSLGYSLVTYTSHVQNIISMTDISIGLFKALVFGATIGAVGCFRGMQTKSGAGGVGVATTRAVVTAIIMLVILEGIFSVMLHYLKI